MNRIYRNTLHQTTYQKQSPLHEIEPTCVDFFIRVAETGQPLSIGECLLFINSLIQDTVHQQNLIQFKKHHFSEEYLCNKTDSELGKVGRNYWSGFYKRNRDKLSATTEKKFELNRSNWTKYRFFSQMYTDIFRVMVEAGVARKLLNPVWMNKEGVTVLDEADSFGMKVCEHLEYPKAVLVLDEAGADSAMMSDGSYAGRKVVGERGTTSRRRSTKKSKRYTIIPLVSLSGQAVMCVLIIDGVERNSFVESGVDIFQVDESILQDDISTDEFVANYGKGKAFPGGPDCHFRGKTIPCMVRMKKGVSVDEFILTDIFRTLDELGLYSDLQAQGIQPVVILDGHQSRFKLPFLQYITADETRWRCCIGVPYGTALWQVNDAPIWRSYCTISFQW